MSRPLDHYHHVVQAYHIWRELGCVNLPHQPSPNIFALLALSIHFYNFALAAGTSVSFNFQVLLGLP